jgi:hypothetical protein
MADHEQHSPEELQGGTLADRDVQPEPALADLISAWYRVARVQALQSGRAGSSRLRLGAGPREEG